MRTARPPAELRLGAPQVAGQAIGQETMPRGPSRILIAWLIVGPILGTVVSLVTGEPRGQEVVLGTTGGLVGGILYWLVEGDDTVLTALSVLAGALALMLLYDALQGLRTSAA
jgi:hypothetical protein